MPSRPKLTTLARLDQAGFDLIGDIVRGHHDDVHLFAGLQSPRHAAAAGISGRINRGDTGLFRESLRNSLAAALEMAAAIDSQLGGWLKRAQKSAMTTVNARPQQEPLRMSFLPAETFYLYEIELA